MDILGNTILNVENDSKLDILHAMCTCVGCWLAFAVKEVFVSDLRPHPLRTHKSRHESF